MTRLFEVTTENLRPFTRRPSMDNYRGLGMRTCSIQKNSYVEVLIDLRQTA